MVHSNDKLSVKEGKLCLRTIGFEAHGMTALAKKIDAWLQVNTEATIARIFVEQNHHLDSSGAILWYYI